MTREYRLTKSHKVDGVMRDPGYVFADRRMGEWLIEQGKAKRVDRAALLNPPPKRRGCGCH